MQLKRTTKEIVRHLILRSGLNRAYLAFRTATGQNIEHLKGRTLEQRFSTIYQNQIWSQGRAGRSLSGLGSEIANTKSIQLHLPGLLSALGTKVLLDVGCGDFNWMSKIELPCKYVGIDVVPGVIEQNLTAFGSGNRTFYTLDATSSSLPYADTVLCRELLFHLSFDHIRSFLENIRKSEIKTLIATTDDVTSFNSDIVSGDFRLLNLMKAPFRFAEPECSIPDDEVTSGRTLGVWNMNQLPERF
jgi:SAM-dependent methyltransferase